MVSVQQRDQCMYVVRVETPAACPVRVNMCAPNCPASWRKDGECDAGCYNAECDFDGGDCATPPKTAGQCAPGCVASWRGDKECDEECDNEACGFDGGDCSGVCAPGCQPAWLKDGECDDECNTDTCEADGGDCLKDGKRTSQARCSWGCPSAWRGDKQCDIGCNVTACDFDDGDCGIFLPDGKGKLRTQWEPSGPISGLATRPVDPPADPPADPLHPSASSRSRRPSSAPRGQRNSAAVRAPAANSPAAKVEPAAEQRTSNAPPPGFTSSAAHTMAAMAHQTAAGLRRDGWPLPRLDGSRLWLLASVAIAVCLYCCGVMVARRLSSRMQYRAYRVRSTTLANIR